MKILARFLILCLLLTSLLPFEAAGQTTDANQTTTSAAGAPPIELAESTYTAQNNLSSNYRLGPGDKIEVHITVGDNDLTVDYSFLINPQGKIFFPGVGEVILTGLTLERGKGTLLKAIRNNYQEKVDLSLMILEPKKIKVYLTGQVNKPGLYKIYDGTKVSEIIRMVGAAKGGSERNIVIKRGQENLTVDLYDVLYRGAVAADLDVRMGDVIEVLPSGFATITVLGEVPRPGQYESKPGETIKDALAMAGFVGANAALSKVVYLRRQKAEEKFNEYKLNLYKMFISNDNAENYSLTDGDILTVPAIKSFIYVYGEVGKSGRFDYLPGQTLSDYINLAGGPSVKANLGNVTVTRQENGKPKVYHINADKILLRGNMDKDIEVLAGDVINVPGNFFYFSDFASFANTILLTFTLYSTVAR